MTEALHPLNTQAVDRRPYLHTAPVLPKDRRNDYRLDHHVEDGFGAALVPGCAFSSQNPLPALTAFLQGAVRVI